MGYKNKTYVIFDGDNDMWSYKYMKGWKVSQRIDFNFHDAHDVFPLTNRAVDEKYIKSKLKERFKTAKQVIVLVGESTKNLHRYVRWEIEVALALDLPIIAVNLNKLRKQDRQKVPAILRDKYAVHISFRAKIIKYALDNFPDEFKKRNSEDKGARYYPKSVYDNLNL